MSELSIIIPTSNSMGDKKNGLKLVLTSIERQTVDKTNIEIIFVDNGSQDDTLSFIQIWANAHRGNFERVQLYSNPDPINRSKSRNIGVESANSEKLLFMDDDTVIYNTDTIAMLIHKYYKKNTFFCGAQRYWTIVGWEYSRIYQELTEDSSIETFAFLPKGISRETGYRDLQEFSFIGNFGGLLKEDFIENGGFDEIRFPDRQEDVDFMYRLLLNKLTFIHLPDDIKVIHLTHPMITSKMNGRLFWINEFRKKEQEEGYYFCVNHLFKVYEDESDFHPVLKRI